MYIAWWLVDTYPITKERRRASEVCRDDLHFFKLLVADWIFAKFTLFANANFKVITVLCKIVTIFVHHAMFIHWQYRIIHTIHTDNQYLLTYTTWDICINFQRVHKLLTHVSLVTSTAFTSISFSHCRTKNFHMYSATSDDFSYFWYLLTCQTGDFHLIHPDRVSQFHHPPWVEVIMSCRCPVMDINDPIHGISSFVIHV